MLNPRINSMSYVYAIVYFLFLFIGESIRKKSGPHDDWADTKRVIIHP